MTKTHLLNADAQVRGEWPKTIVSSDSVSYAQILGVAFIAMSQHLFWLDEKKEAKNLTHSCQLL